MILIHVKCSFQNLSLFKSCCLFLLMCVFKSVFLVNKSLLEMPEILPATASCGSLCLSPSSQHFRTGALSLVSGQASSLPLSWPLGRSFRNEDLTTDSPDDSFAANGQCVFSCPEFSDSFRNLYWVLIVQQVLCWALQNQSPGGKM